MYRPLGGHYYLRWRNWAEAYADQTGQGRQDAIAYPEWLGQELQEIPLGGF
jgi:hypothetical protein